MERLTYRDNSLPRKTEDGELIEAYSDYDVRSIINRLAAYEDTGLEPEEIVKYRHYSEYVHKLFPNLQHIDELAKANRESRLVVLPCKLGETVWRISRHMVDVTGYRMEWEWETVIQATKFYIGMYDAIGKTVFLTREEAEQALEGMK